MLWEKVPHIFLKRLHKVCLHSFYLEVETRDKCMIKIREDVFLGQL
jgi:hypothetical protein